MFFMPNILKNLKVTNKHSLTGVICFVLLPFGTGFYLSYLYRTMNLVIEPQLRLEFDLGASGIGFLTGIYFISFAAVQIPVGIAIDYFGPKRVQIVLLSVAAIGGVVFAFGNNFLELAIGRLLIGIGVAGGIVSVLSANAIWFKPDQQPLMNSIGVCFGGLGALSATLPMELLLSFVSWRELFISVSVFTIALVVFIWFVVPDKRVALSESKTFRAHYEIFVQIFMDSYFWRIGFLIITGFAAYISYQSLWAGPWLRDVGGFERLARAEILLLVQLGMFTGILFGGLLADRVASRGKALERLISIGVVLYFLCQIGLILGLIMFASILWFGFGFFGSVLFLTYSLYGQYYPASVNGRVNTANNLLMFGLVFITQWGVGIFIEQWPSLGEQKYPAVAHQWALFIVLAMELVAFIWFIFPRDLVKEKA